jgi:hypothetical protein
VPLAVVVLAIAGGEPIVLPVPEPEREIVLACVLAQARKPIMVTTDRLPLVGPVAWGAKVTERLMLWSGARMIGKLGPLKLKPVPETDACEMVMYLLLVLVTEVDSVLLLPSWTLPKSRPEEASASCPEAALAYKTTLRRSK